MKAVSDFVLILLISIIALSSISVVWFYYNAYFKHISLSGDTSSLGEALSSCMKIDSVKNNKIYLKNCGSGLIKNNTLNIYFDDDPINFSMTPKSIKKGEVATIDTYLDVENLDLGNHKLRIASPSGDVERFVKVGKESYSFETPNDVLNLNFSERQGKNTYDSSGYGNDGVFREGDFNDGTVYASGRNQVKNPSFEKGKQYWGTGDGDWQIVSDEKYHGVNSSRFQDLVLDSGSEATDYIFIPVTPGQKITVSAYSKGNNIQWNGGETWYRAFIQGRWVDSAKNAIAGSYPDMTLGYGTGTWDWMRNSSVFTAINGAAYYMMRIVLYGNVTGTLWVDAVQVEYGDTLTDFTDSLRTSGYFGKGLELDGVDDLVSVPHDDTLNVSNLTITVWLKPAEDIPAVAEKRCFIRKRGPKTGFLVYINNDTGKMTMDYGNGTNNCYPGTSFAWTKDVWYHVAITHDEITGETRFYRDGALAGVGLPETEECKFIEPNDENLNMSSQGCHWNGTMDEVRIFDRVLSLTEIQAEMQSSLPVERPVASYNFEEPDSANYVNDTHIWVKGVYGSALGFDGINDWVEVLFDNTLDVAGDNLTMMAWIRGFDNQEYGDIYTVKLPEALGLRVYSSLGMWYNLSDGTENHYSTGYNVLDNKWHHIAVTKSDNTYSFYDNGTYVDGTTLGNGLNIEDHLRSIASCENFGHFKGIIDEARIYNTSLTEAEIQSVMQGEELEEIEYGEVILTLGEFA